MNRGTKTGFGTISLERLQCARLDCADPTEKKKKKEEEKEDEEKEDEEDREDEEENEDEEEKTKKKKKDDEEEEEPKASNVGTSVSTTSVRNDSVKKRRTYALLSGVGTLSFIPPQTQTHATHMLQKANIATKPTRCSLGDRIERGRSLTITIHFKVKASVELRLHYRIRVRGNSFVYGKMYCNHQVHSDFLIILLLSMYFIRKQ
jgi:hypothetical protein